jgi:hypothetical protein
MAKSRGELCFSAEAADELRVMAVRWQHSFETNSLLEPTCTRPRRLERLGHATDAKTAQKAVGPELSGLTLHPYQLTISPDE